MPQMSSQQLTTENGSSSDCVRSFKLAGIDHSGRHIWTIECN